jgi:REP element-mobilizing transposase RayT
MASHICLRVHFIWSTQHREPLLREDWDQRLHAYLGSILAEHDGVLLAAGGVADHIHVYTSLPSTLSLADAANALKSNSSRWIKETFGVSNFAWQSGYGAFSVSPSQDANLRNYIATQKEHHRVRTFKEEYIEFLRRHEIEYDPQYVFE